MNNIMKGKMGENYATEYLISKGYDILERNFRCKLGEIDIIGEIEDLIVFFEVKSRTSNYYGYPYEAVNWKKQNKIIKTSLFYMKMNKLANIQFRFDILEVYLGKSLKINHIENAFCQK